MIGLPFLPESPRWLAKVDRVDEALHILANIQADGDLENPYVVAEFEEIMTVLTAERLAPKSWRKFVYNGMWRRTLAGFSVQAWQQLSGAVSSKLSYEACRVVHHPLYLPKTLGHFSFPAAKKYANHTVTFRM
jgi:hypothetical protein